MLKHQQRKETHKIITNMLCHMDIGNPNADASIQAHNNIENEFHCQERSEDVIKKTNK